MNIAGGAISKNDFELFIINILITKMLGCEIKRFNDDSLDVRGFDVRKSINPLVHVREDRTFNATNIEKNIELLFTKLSLFLLVKLASSA